MSTSKLLAAAVCAATVSLAFAQGVPPRPATNPAIGAGQRSTQGTPMGTTGTPGGGGGVAAQGSMAGSAAATTAGSMGTTGGTIGSTGSSMNSGATASNMDMGSTGTHHVAKKSKKHHKHVAKPDRN
jgi:hypothetical protein